MTIYPVLIAIIWLKLSAIDAFIVPLPIIKSVHTFPTLKLTNKRSSSFALAASTNNTNQFISSNIDMRKLKGLANTFQEGPYGASAVLRRVEFSSVKEFTKLIFDKTKPDVKLELPNGKWFLVHRIVLSTCSSQFRDLLSSPNATTVDSDGLTVLKLDDDVDDNVMKELISFMYSNEFTSLTYDLMLRKVGPSLYYAALKYQVQGVIDLCEAYLVGCIGASTVLYLMDVASIYNIQRLKTAATDYINTNPQQVMNRYVKDLLGDD